MPTIAIINNKGGTGKSKSVENLGWCMAQTGQAVTLIDADGQANLTKNLGIDIESDHNHRLPDILAGQSVHTYSRAEWPLRLSLIGSDHRLDESATEMVMHPLRISRVSAIIRDSFAPTEIVLIDTPPNIGPLVYSALLAADYAIIPAVPVAESIAGVERMFRLLSEIRQETGRAPAVLGIIATHVQETTIAHQVGLEALGSFRSPLLGCVPHRIGRDAHAQLQAAYRPIAARILYAIGQAVASEAVASEGGAE